MSSGRIPSVEGGIQPTIVDAKGDLIVATAADTVSRLAVGSNDQVLTADSTTATGVKWATASAGSMTLISTTTLSGSSVSLTSIPSGYINLVLYVVKCLPATDSTSLRLQFNGDTASNYYYSMSWAGSTSGGGSANMNGSSTISNTVATSNYSVITVYDYLNTTTKKMMTSISINTDPTLTSQLKSASSINTWDSTNAITSIQLFMSSGNFTSGTVLLYGVK